MSIRGFAEHLGYNDAAVSNWERRGETARLRTQTQRDLDAALKLADDDARERFFSTMAQATLSITAPSSEHKCWAESGQVVLDCASPCSVNGNACMCTRPTDRDLVGHWGELLRVLATAGNAVGAYGLLDVVRREVTAIDHQRRASSGSLRRSLSALVARWLEFGSWVADNEKRSPEVDGWLEVAAVRSQEAEDRVLAAFVVMRYAQRAVEAGNPSVGAPMAAAVARKPSLPGQVSALAAIRCAHGHALAGEATVARTEIDLALRCLERAGEPADAMIAEMVGHCTPAYIRGYEAICRLELGEPEAATTGLQQVLANWPVTHRLDEGLFRAYLAVALTQAGEQEAAEAEAATAHSVGTQTGSQRTLAVLDRIAVA
jgi:hypothetical protein